MVCPACMRQIFHHKEWKNERTSDSTRTQRACKIIFCALRVYVERFSYAAFTMRWKKNLPALCRSRFAQVDGIWARSVKGDESFRSRSKPASRYRGSSVVS